MSTSSVSCREPLASKSAMERSKISSLSSLISIALSVTVDSIWSAAMPAESTKRSPSSVISLILVSKSSTTASSASPSSFSSSCSASAASSRLSVISEMVAVVSSVISTSRSLTAPISASSSLKDPTSCGLSSFRNCSASLMWFSTSFWSCCATLPICSRAVVTVCSAVVVSDWVEICSIELTIDASWPARSETERNSGKLLRESAESTKRMVSSPLPPSIRSPTPEASRAISGSMIRSWSSPAPISTLSVSNS